MSINRSSEKTEELLKEANGRNLTGTYSIEEFVNSLESPRKRLIMVKAGKPVEDTIRRSRSLEHEGYRYIGTGVSGGEEGAPCCTYIGKDFHNLDSRKACKG